MREVKVQALSRDAFHPYGSYTQLIMPHDSNKGAVAFTPDLLGLDLARFTKASFSICRAAMRDFVIEVGEYHSYTAEGIIPLDGDILLHVGAPTFGPQPWDKYEVFRVPQGYMVSLRAGVWHHAPFAIDKTVSTIIVLPERTYANDCIVDRLDEDKKSRIIL